MPTLTQRIRSGWNAFIGRDPTLNSLSIQEYGGYSSGLRPDRVRYRANSQRTIVAAIYNRIAVDVASIRIEHVRLDENDQYKETLKSSINERLTVSANLDQSATAFKQDLVESLFDEGVVAVVPVDTDIDPSKTESYKIESLRVGKIVNWYPKAVKVHLYNEETGKYQDVLMAKSEVAIIPNPFYSTMNEPNSTAQRLMTAINKLNTVNDMSTSSKLDLIIKLPYVTKSDQRRREAEKKRKELEHQLADSKLGIGYIDATDSITQLNRSLDNNLWAQVKELTEQLFSQLGVTPTILDGTADEATRINYFNSTIAPICQAIVDEFTRKFLSKTARSQKQAFKFYRDPFKLVPVSQLAEIADKFTRNAIMSSNELRGEIGLKPVENDPMADKLLNKNLNLSKEQEEEIYGGSSSDSVQNDDEGTDESGTKTESKSSSSVDSLLKSLGNTKI